MTVLDRELPSANKKTHASHVLILTTMDDFCMHFLKIIVCYMEQNMATAHCVILYQRSSRCHCSKTQAQHWQNKHYSSRPIIMSWVIVYWKGSLHMSLWCLCEVIFQNFKRMVTNFCALCQQCVKQNKVYSVIPNLKVAQLDYNVNWNIITSPAQCLCVWHNSTGGFKRGETFFSAHKHSGIYYTEPECSISTIHFFVHHSDDRLTVF